MGALVKAAAPRLPALLYHHVGPPRPDAYPLLTVSPDRFERQVRWLARAGFTGIRPSDWLMRRRDAKALPRKPVLLTFDDGYADLADYAFPVLRRHGFAAAVYIVTGQVGGVNAWDMERGYGRLRLLTEEQILEAASQGIEFGAHGRVHADLTALSGEDLQDEVAESGRRLAGILGRRALSFAYPYGAHDELVRGRVGETFDLAFTVEEGLNELGTDPLRLRRTMIMPGDTLLEFACRVRFGFNPIERLRARLRLRTRAREAWRLLAGLKP